MIVRGDSWNYISRGSYFYREDTRKESQQWDVIVAARQRRSGSGSRRGVLKTLIITDNCVEHGPTILPQQQQEEQQQHELQTELCSGPGHNAIFLRATNQSLISFSYKVQVIDSRYESIVWTLTELRLFALLPLSLSPTLAVSLPLRCRRHFDCVSCPISLRALECVKTCTAP